jgi:hypothetical protein
MASNTHGNLSRTHSLPQNSRDIQTSNASGRTITTTQNFDDVIASLANMTENRRARQVLEWESLRRRTFRSWA